NKPGAFGLLLLLRQLRPGFDLCIPAIRERRSITGVLKDGQLRCIFEGRRAAVVWTTASHGIDTKVVKGHLRNPVHKIIHIPTPVGKETMVQVPTRKSSFR